MSHAKQAWEDLAETGKLLTDKMFNLTNQGIDEYDILLWLARYHQGLVDFESDESEAEQLTAKILEATAKDWEKIALKAINAGTVLEKPAGKQISDEDAQHQLNEVLFPMMDEGEIDVDDVGILRWLALWRKQASMEEGRGSLRAVDLQCARLLHAAADKLDNALEEWAESDPFIPCEYQERPQPIQRELPKVGRNDPCPCGSNKKYKKCHGT